MNYYDAIKAALSSTGIPVYHNHAVKQPNKYVVWSETGIDSFKADDISINDKLIIAVDFFTKSEYDELNFRKIRESLELYHFALSATAVDYEVETGFTHYALTAEWAG